MTEVPPIASATTFLACIQCIQRRKVRHASVHSAVMVSFLQPVGLDCRAELNIFPRIDRRTVVDWTLSSTLRNGAIDGLLMPVLTSTAECTIGSP
jgi:hypothetical protein